MVGSDCNQDRNFSSLIAGLNTWKTMAHFDVFLEMISVSSIDENVFFSSFLAGSVSVSSAEKVHPMKNQRQVFLLN